MLVVIQNNIFGFAVTHLNITQHTYPFEKIIYYIKIQFKYLYNNNI
jgi:hypothetical protein